MIKILTFPTSADTKEEKRKKKKSLWRQNKPFCNYFQSFTSNMQSYLNTSPCCILRS